jgi:hypothetical protein
LKKIKASFDLNTDIQDIPLFRYASESLKNDKEVLQTIIGNPFNISSIKDEIKFLKLTSNLIHSGLAPIR